MLNKNSIIENAKEWVLHYEKELQKRILEAVFGTQDEQSFQEEARRFKWIF